MFSGITQSKGQIIEIQKADGLLTLVIDLGELANGLQVGASVSVAGVCLTVVDTENKSATFEIIGETLSKTTLESIKDGAWVNIERSLQVGDELGGHRVSGHVTGTATIKNIETPANNCVMTFWCNAAWMDYILPKGFIALDGCSLTVVDTGPDWFTVHLIPETLRVTTFVDKKIHDQVNLEIDSETQTIVETAKKYLHQQSGKL